MLLVFSTLIITNLMGQWEALNEGTRGKYNAIDFIGDDTGWVAGGESGLFGGKPTLIKTENGGETWKVLRLDGNYAISGIDFLNDSLGWAIGMKAGLLIKDKSYILNSRDGGTTWAIQSEGSGSLYGIFAVNDRVVYTAGAEIDSYVHRGLVFKTAKNFSEISTTAGIRRD